MQKTPIIYRFIGDEYAGKNYMARARAEMLTLERTVAFRSANSNKLINKSMIATRTVRPNTHTIIKCIKVAGMSIAEITIGTQRGRRVKKEKEKLLKMYVHVDMINTDPGNTPSEDWHLEYYKHVYDSTLGYTNWTTYICDQVNTDKFTREMVTSAVACGIVNQESGNIVWSDVKVPVRVPDEEDEDDTSEEWLAVNDLVPWKGIYVTGGGVSTANTVLEYYNELFPAAKKTLPVLTSDDTWLAKQDLEDTDIPDWSTYPVFPGTADWNGIYWYRSIPTGWDNPYIQYEGLWVDPKYFFYSINNMRHDLYTTPTDGLNPYQYSLNTKLVARYGSYVDDLGSTRWDEDLSPTGQWYTAFTNYHPILGHMWSGYVEAKAIPYSRVLQPSMSCQTWVDPPPYADYPWYKIWRNILEVQPFKEHVNIYRDSDFPWYSPEDLPYKHILTDGLDLDPGETEGEPYRYKVPSDDITQNYILPSGFKCAIATYGGILANKDSLYTKECDPVYVHDEWHEDIVSRTLLNIAVKAGDADTGKLSPAAVTLATMAFEFLGGQVYGNDTLPQLMSDEHWSFINYYSQHSWPKYNDYVGLIYASPAYNIKVYVVPVGDK